MMGPPVAPTITLVPLSSPEPNNLEVIICGSVTNIPEGSSIQILFTDYWTHNWLPHTAYAEVWGTVQGGVFYADYPVVMRGPGMYSVDAQWVPVLTLPPKAKAPSLAGSVSAP